MYPCAVAILNCGLPYSANLQRRGAEQLAAQKLQGELHLVDDHEVEPHVEDHLVFLLPLAKESDY